MRIEKKILNSTLYVGLNGELDTNTAEHVRKNLDELFLASNMERVVIDLSELSFMDSTGIGVMIGRFKRLKARNIPVFISHPSPQADKIFKISGLYDIMPKIG